MNISDPISDMLTRIRNASRARKKEVTMPASNLKKAVAEVMKKSGYIRELEVRTEDNKANLIIELKYHGDVPVIEGLERVSKPSRRIYANSNDLPRVLGGLGIAVLSTSAGVMSNKAAREQGVGGEVLCYVW
ncbi:MAG: 30S ribosomal protein S8 [Verrucomicrobiota bacterium]